MVMVRAGWSTRAILAPTGRRPHAHAPAATLRHSWTSTSSPRCAAPARSASSTPSRSATTCSAACSTRALRPQRRQPAGMARHRRQGPGGPHGAARHLPRRLVRVPGLGVGRPGALGPGHRPGRRGGSDRQRRGVRRGSGRRRPGSPRPSIRAPALLLVLADLSRAGRGGPRPAPLHAGRRRLHLPLRVEPPAGRPCRGPGRRHDDAWPCAGRTRCARSSASPTPSPWRRLVVLGRPVTAPRRLTRVPVELLRLGRPLRGRPRWEARHRPPLRSRGEMGHGTERPGRRAPALQLRPADRLLPRRLLQHRRRGRRRPHRLHPGDRRVPGVLGLGRQRPVHPAPRVRLRRAAARRPVVPVRRALAGGLRGRHGAPGRPGVDPRRRPWSGCSWATSSPTPSSLGARTGAGSNGSSQHAQAPTSSASTE